MSMVPLMKIKHYLLEINTGCGLAFLCSGIGPCIYQNYYEALSDIDDDGDEAVLQVYLQSDGKIATDFYGWDRIVNFLIIEGFSEKLYRSYIMGLIKSDDHQ